MIGDGQAYRDRRERLRQMLTGQLVWGTPEGQRKYDRITAASDAHWAALGGQKARLRRGVVWGLRR